MFVKYVGLTAETAELIERFRETSSQLDDQIIRVVFQRAMKPTGLNISGGGSAKTGCDLGDEVSLGENEKMYCFRYKSSLEAKKPEGIAIAKGGWLYIDGQKIEPSKGSLVQPALQFVQKKIGDRSHTNGGLVSLNAWEIWYVSRNGRLTRVGDLRPKDKIVRRERHKPDIDLSDLDLDLEVR